MNFQKYLGNYEVEAALGGNAFFESYRAIDTIRKRPVIIKTLKQETTRDQKKTQRFLEQARLASELVHPHLAWIWEAGVIDGQCFLVERFVEGHTLRQILNREEKLPNENAHAIISQISRGLDFAHARGFAHGNIKPENIQINPDLGAILTDLGPSIALQAITSRWTNVIDLEMAPYSAPEIWEGRPPSAESDQYSLACIFAEILSGEKPFGASTLNAIKESHLAVFQAPLSWAVSIPWPTAKAILRALEPEPSKRYQNMDAFTQAPQSILAEINLDPQLKKESEIQAKAWEAAQQKARQEAEEAVRLEALEKARREIDEELQRQEPDREMQPSATIEKPYETPIEERPTVPSEEALDAGLAGTSREKSRSRTVRASFIRRGWWWITLVIILVILTALGLANSFSMDKNLATITPTQTALSASITPTLSATPTSEATVTPSASSTKTATRTKTNTPTRTPTITPTNTITTTASLTITPTRTPKDEDNSISGSQLIKPFIQTVSP